MATLTIKGISDNLYKRLKDVAERERRSLNSQVIVCLERELGGRRIDAGRILRRADNLRKASRLPRLTDAFLRRAKGEGRP